MSDIEIRISRKMPREGERKNGRKKEREMSERARGTR